MEMENDKKFSLSVFLFIFDNDYTKILLIKRNAEKRKKWGFDWGFVGGKVEEGETPIEAAERELFEEAGLKNLKLKEVYVKQLNKDSQVFYHHYFVAQISEKEKLRFQRSEIKQVKWFSLGKLPKSRASDSPKKMLKMYKGSRE